jgi:hypothetical protein
MLHFKHGFIHCWIWSQFIMLLNFIRSRIKVWNHKEFGYLDKMVGINSNLFQFIAIHNDTCLVFPFCYEHSISLQQPQHTIILF